MTRKELRRAMRARKKELRRALPALRRQALEQVRELPAVRRARARKRLRRAVLWGLALLLLALLGTCECQSGPPAPHPKAAPAAKAKQVEKPAAPPAPTRRRPLGGKVDRQVRPGFTGADADGPAWLDEFRLQVAARSVRLAQCFTGTDRPGALRWSAAVNPQSGTASDHDLEPVGPGFELDGEQRACVVGVLSSPRYRLTAAAAQALPNRVSLVIEF